MFPHTPVGYHILSRTEIDHILYNVLTSRKMKFCNLFSILLAIIYRGRQYFDVSSGTASFDVKSFE